MQLFISFINVQLIVNSSTNRKAKSGELIPAGPPSVFPGVPRLLVPTPPPKPRKLNRLAIRSAQPDEVATFNDQDSFDESNYGDKLAAVSKDARVFSTDSEWRILADERSGSVPSFSVFISKQTQLAECYSKFVKVAVPFVSGKKVNKVSQVEAIVDYLRKYVHGGSQVSFIERQIELTGCHRFNPTDLENAFALRSKSSACYDAFREFLVLPDRRILQRWKKPVSDIENVPSVEEMLDVHEPQQRQCVLLSDEDNVKPMIV